MIQRFPKTALLLFVLLLSFGLAACDDDDNGTVDMTPTEDAQDDTSDIPDVSEDLAQPDMPDLVQEPDMNDPPPPTIPLTPVQEGIGENGADIDAPIEDGQVRAGRVTQGDGGFQGAQAVCNTGDLVLANSVARFCIEAVQPTQQIYFAPGQIIDAIPAGLDPLPNGEGRDRLDNLATLSDYQTGRGESVDLIRDGTVALEGDNVAVVRVEGEEEPVMYLAGVIGTALFRKRSLRVFTEYRLRPDTAFLEIVTVIENTSDNKIFTTAPGDIVFWGDTITSLPPVAGPEGGFFASLAYGHGVSYGMFTEHPFSTVILPGVDLPASLVSHPSGRLASGHQVAARRWLGVAAQTGSLMARHKQERPDHPLSALNAAQQVITVQRGAQGLASAKVTATAPDAEEVLQATYTDAQGDARLWLPDGTWSIRIEGPDGGVVTEEITLTEGSAQILAVPEVGQLDIQVQASIAGDVQDSPARLVLRETTTGDTRRWFILRGQDSRPLPAGTWTWELSRGPEFDFAAGEITVIPGEEAAHIEATLTHVVPTPGAISGEFHQHQTASLDSEVAVRDRVLSNLSEGVDFAVSSDHDIVTDFGPVIEELGATDLIATVTGVEVSPLWGHFGAYPMEQKPNAMAQGAPTLAWYDDQGEIQRMETGAQLIGRLRNEFGVRMIQVNHPRDNPSAYFSTAGFDRTAPWMNASDGFSEDFDTMEIINGENCLQVQDWFALLNQGVRVIGVGNSDTHSLSGPPGYPRNYMRSDATSPEQLTQDGLVDSVLTGDVVVSAIAYLDIARGGAQMGQITSSASETLDLRVLTPPWAQVDRLVLVRNGQQAEELVIGGGEGAIVDFDGQITLQTEGDQDAWFVLMTYHSQDLRPNAVYPGRRVYAISNPFYLDADGDGDFTPPGADQAPDPGVVFFCPEAQE